MIEQLQNDKNTVKILQKQIRASRWFMFNIDQECREDKNDEERQHFMIHGNAKVWVGENKSCTPYGELQPGTRILAIRKYMGGPYTAIVNLAYYFYHGAHRCNLAQDSDLGAGVYAYTDRETLLSTLDYTKVEDRQTCIGVISGFLLKSAGKSG